MIAPKPYLLAAMLILIGGAIYLISLYSIPRTGPNEPVTVAPRTSGKSQIYELAKEITTPDGFINTNGKSITINELIGKKVILIDFWTYSCINCQRTTPYLNAWYEKYGIAFPVVLDNDYSTWTAYKNRYWPRKYLIDIDGYIVYDHIGEGAYEET